MNLFMVEVLVYHRSHRSGLLALPQNGFDILVIVLVTCSGKVGCSV